LANKKNANITKQKQANNDIGKRFLHSYKSSARVITRREWCQMPKLSLRRKPNTKEAEKKALEPKNESAETKGAEVKTEPEKNVSEVEAVVEQKADTESAESPKEQTPSQPAKEDKAEKTKKNQKNHH
jgi:hypothetical protein